MPEQTPWHRLFVGRDAELAQLRSMLMDCAPSLAPVASGAAYAPAPCVRLRCSTAGHARAFAMLQLSDGGTDENGPVKRTQPVLFSQR